MQILIGTTNVGKQKEFTRILKQIDSSIDIIFPQDLSITKKPNETGKTFEENSLLKAKFYFEKTGVPTIADDGGLEIAILNNEPGVKSRRWLGHEASDEELIQYTLKKLDKYQNNEDRKARLRTCITFYNDVSFQECASIEGYIATKPLERRHVGYPFRSLFIVSSLNKYYDELTKSEHDQYNHRQRALTKLWKKIVTI